MADRAVAAVFVDGTGRTRLQVVKAATNPCTILTDLLALSNAATAYNFDGLIDPAQGTAVAAPYQAAQLYANLQFTTATGAILQLQIIAPQVAIFLADGVTVDPAAVASLVADCIGNLSDGAGNVATAYLGGSLAPSKGSYQSLGV
jgi:hypothetical protein